VNNILKQRQLNTITSYDQPLITQTFDNRKFSTISGLDIIEDDLNNSKERH